MAVSSSGGHLSELFQSISLDLRRNVFYITSKDNRSDTMLSDMKHAYIIDPNGRFFWYILNFLQSLYFVIKYRPGFIISTGSGIAVFSLLIGKAVGAKIIYIESGARLNELSRTGSLIYKVSDLFVVRSPVLHAKYKKSHMARLF